MSALIKTTVSPLTARSPAALRAAPAPFVSQRHAMNPRPLMEHWRSLFPSNISCWASRLSRCLWTQPHLLEHRQEKSLVIKGHCASLAGTVLADLLAPLVLKRQDARARTRTGKGGALSRGRHSREGTRAASRNPSAAPSQAFRNLLGNNTYRKSCLCVCSQTQFGGSQETCSRTGD